jgi:DNA-binding NtrC family response regulator
LKSAAEIQPQAVRIILTGYADIDEVKQEVENGNVYTHIVKPWNDENLKNIVAQAAKYYETNKKRSI